MFFFFKQKTADEMRISDWSSDVCSSDLLEAAAEIGEPRQARHRGAVAVGQLQHVIELVALQRLGQNHPLRLAPALGQAAKHLRHVVELTEHRHPVNVAPDAGALLIDGTKHFESAVAVARHLADEGFGGIAGKTGRAPWRKRVCQYV